MIEHVQKIIVKQSKGIEGTYYIIAKAMDDPKWRAKMLIPLSVILMILGLGIILPQGELLIGGLPFLFGAYLLAKGLGVDDTVARVIGDMRENVDAAMFSSLLWLGGVFTAILSIVQGWNEYSRLTEDSTISGSIIIEIFHSSLAWIVLTFLLMIGGLLLLRLRRGSFSGRMLIIAAFGMVVYSSLDAALTIISDAITNPNFEFAASEVLPQLWSPIFWVIVLWMTMTVVRSLRDKISTGNTYWGI